MQQIIEFLPLLAFFVAYKFSDIYVATGVLIVATALQVGYTYLKHKKVDKMPLFTLALLVVFGGLTIVLQDDLFLKWKVTIVYWLFAAIMLFSQFFMQQTIAQSLLGKELKAPREIFSRVNWAWIVFFIASGFVNLWVAFNFSQETWVQVKVFGFLAATLVYMVITVTYLYRNRYPDEDVTHEEKTGE